jgi:hypothetical protein
MCNQSSHDDDVQHRDEITDSESNREKNNLMKMIFWVNTIRFDEEIAHTLRQSSDFSRVKKRNVKAWHEVETC